MGKAFLIDAGSKAAKILDRQEKALGRIVAFALVDQENGGVAWLFNGALSERRGGRVALVVTPSRRFPV